VEQSEIDKPLVRLAMQGKYRKPGGKGIKGTKRYKGWKIEEYETGRGTHVLENRKGKKDMLVSLETPHWTAMVRQRIIVRMGQQTALRSWALNVVNELPDVANCHWATSVLGSPYP
jgi:hypothetical protein